MDTKAVVLPEQFADDVRTKYEKLTQILHTRIDALIAAEKEIEVMEAQVIAEREAMAEDLAWVHESNELFKANNVKSEDVIKVDVGGIEFTTTKATLLKSKKIQEMIDTKVWKKARDGSYFVDRHAGSFLIILDLMRCGKLMLTETTNFQRLERELRWYGCDSDLIVATLDNIVSGYKEKERIRELALKRQSETAKKAPQRFKSNKVYKDWICDDADCGAANFSNRQECYKCGRGKPENPEIRERDMSKQSESKPKTYKDWVCPSCDGNNYSNKTECFSCGEPKPENPEIRERAVQPKKDDGDFNNLEDYNADDGEADYS